LDENNTKGVVLLQLWADDTLLQIRRRKLLNNEPQQEDEHDNATIEMIERDIQRVRDNTAACLQKDEITVTDFVIMLNDMTRYNRMATRWLFHQSTRINPILFSGPLPHTNGLDR
jgi:signal transduction protein with GAF and PtsI domain